jgi:hypothetical protein
MNGNASIKKLERNLIVASLNGNNNALNRIAKTIQQQLNARKNTTRQRIILNIIKPRYNGNLNALARNLANSRNLKVLNAASIRDHLGGKYNLSPSQNGKTSLKPKKKPSMAIPIRKATSSARRAVVTEVERAIKKTAYNNHIISMITRLQKLKEQYPSFGNKFNNSIRNLQAIQKMQGTNANKLKRYLELYELYKNNNSIKRHIGIPPTPAPAPHQAQSRRASLYKVVNANPNTANANERQLHNNINEYSRVLDEILRTSPLNNKTRTKLNIMKESYIRTTNNYKNPSYLGLSVMNRKKIFNSYKQGFIEQIQSTLAGIKSHIDPFERASSAVNPSFASE